MSLQAFCGMTFYLFIYLVSYLFEIFCDVVYLFSGTLGRRIEKIE